MKKIQEAIFQAITNNDHSQDTVEISKATISKVQRTTKNLTAKVNNKMAAIV